MIYLVTGRTDSGKSTFINLISQITDSKHSFVEIKLSDLPSVYDQTKNIIVINTAAIACASRSKRTFDLKQAETQSQLLNHVTDLANCTIIDNNNSIDMFKVQIKKFAKKHL